MRNCFLDTVQKVDPLTAPLPQSSAVQRRPPPCLMHKPDESAAPFLHPGITEPWNPGGCQVHRRFPPPWAAHRVCFRTALSQPGSSQRRPPPWDYHQSKGPGSLLGS